MKKIMFCIVILSFLHTTIYAQEKGKNLSIDAELSWLLKYKSQYEKYSVGADEKNKYTEKNIHKRDSVYKLYINQIEYIRNSPERFLTHIKRSIKNNKVEYDGPAKVPYDYVNYSLPVNPDIHFITRLELYKIVKKYIFEKKAKVLPHRTEAYIKAGGKEDLSIVPNM